MVRIDADKPIQGIAGQPGAQIGMKTTGGGFDSALQEAMGSTSTPKANVASTPFIDRIRPARFEAENSVTEARVLDCVKRLIDTMDVYRQKLMDNGNTLKDIQGLIQDMESQSQSLRSISAEVNNQGELSDVVDQSLMLSSMEIAKFNGGHYN
jgi:hypothetical protein